MVLFEPPGTGCPGFIGMIRTPGGSAEKREKL